MKKLLSIVAGLALVAGISTAAQAQQVTVTGASPLSITTYVSVTVPTLLSLDVNDTSTAVTAPTATDFDNGYQDVASAVIATVKSNTGYTLNIQGGSATWAGGSGTKVVADLLWGNTGPPAGTVMTTSPAVVSTSATGTASDAQTIDYRINWSYLTDTPGTYSMPVIFTLTAP